MKKLIILIAALSLLSACAPLQPKELPPAPTAEEERLKAQGELFMDLGLDSQGTIKRSQNDSGASRGFFFQAPSTLPAFDAPVNP